MSDANYKSLFIPADTSAVVTHVHEQAITARRAKQPSVKLELPLQQERAKMLIKGETFLTVLDVK